MRAPLDYAEPGSPGGRNAPQRANYTLFKRGQSLHACGRNGRIAAFFHLRERRFSAHPGFRPASGHGAGAPARAAASCRGGDRGGDPPAGRAMLDAADGAAIVVLDHPHRALRLAERALNAVAAGLPLSAGSNTARCSSPARKRRRWMTGDGIAVAAAVAAPRRRRVTSLHGVSRCARRRRAGLGGGALAGRYHRCRPAQPRGIHAEPARRRAASPALRRGRVCHGGLPYRGGIAMRSSARGSLHLSMPCSNALRRTGAVS